MGKPLNYYQYEYTGAGTGIAPFVSGLFSGFFLPENFQLGQVNFNLPLLSDFFLFPSNSEVKITGSIVTTNPNSNLLDFSFKGGFFPLYTESGSLKFNLTGQIVKDNIDSFNFNAPFTGQIDSALLDVYTNIINISGNQNAVLKDEPNLISSFTGNFVNNLIESPNFILSFSVKFNKRILDNASVNLQFFSGTFTRGNLITSGFFTDSYNINCQPTRFIWGVGF